MGGCISRNIFTLRFSRSYMAVGTVLMLDAVLAAVLVVDWHSASTEWIYELARSHTRHVPGQRIELGGASVFVRDATLDHPPGLQAVSGKGSILVDLRPITLEHRLRFL